MDEFKQVFEAEQHAQRKLLRLELLSWALFALALVVFGFQIWSSYQ